VTALALDPADTSGNTLFVGTTGGGVWLSGNAGSSPLSTVSFAPRTDNLSALSSVIDASISIGALSVQPGGTKVVLAGTGDPNDEMDSYYGAGILRSTDGGTSWSLIATTADNLYSFTGEGFAGFAWSTSSPQLVVAAVSQAYEGTLVNAVWPGKSCPGLYYSTDSGATWTLATIADSGGDVQGKSDAFAGNAATAVVWNPVRKLFAAAVRYHGYYQSTDGETWTRMAVQPGAGLTTSSCPTNPGALGSTGCPIFRGALAVNPSTGDTFAWTVDGNNQDLGIWQDQCQVSGGACGNQTITFAKQLNTAALEMASPTDTTIRNGDYNLTLAAVPGGVGQGQDTLLFAGGNDLWKCSLAMGCQWRNTTNAIAGSCAQVGEFQHAFAWNASNPAEVFVGNDSGLWRSLDAIGETAPACGAAGNADASHFQNLNGSLGSLAEVESISAVGNTPYTMLAGLGANGVAGVDSSSAPTVQWPQLLSGFGGPVAMNPADTSWYANNQSGVAIYRCTQAPCTAAGFGTAPVIDMNVPGGGLAQTDGLTMPTPAPFLVDPLDATQLLIGTCRVWRGAGSGSGWSAGNAISPIFDNRLSSGPCNGDALIRSMAALALPSGGEVIYVGLYGSPSGNASLPGHVLTATLDASSSSMPIWTDLTSNSVSNDTHAMNSAGMDISSIFVDPLDATGKTVYVTVAGISNVLSNYVQTVYRSTNGGASWTSVTANLPAAPANSVVVDPVDANTVYVATDMGVYSTRNIALCTNAASGCWTGFGSGLPQAPVMQLSASPASSSMNNLVAATYGRGIWTVPLWTATVITTTASATPTSLSFASQQMGSSSAAQAVTLTNTGTKPLTLSNSIAMGGTDPGDFSATDNGSCSSSPVQPGNSCTIEVTFSPTQTGTRAASLIVYADLSGGQLTVPLSGLGAAAGAITLSPSSLSFSPQLVNSSSASLSVTINNSAQSASTVSYALTGPFSATSGCAGNSVAGSGSCPLYVTFTPTQPGVASGSLSVTDASGTQVVPLSGIGLAVATDVLSATALSFPDTIVGQISPIAPAQNISLTNNGGVNLTSIAISIPPTVPFIQTNNCTANLSANGASCTISVQFKPTAAGAQSGTLTVSSSAADSPKTIALSGKGLLAPAFGISPSSLTFATQTVGQSGATQALTITNTGQASMSGIGLAIINPSANCTTSGSSPYCFAWSGSTCGTLAAGAQCSVQVAFTPLTAGGSAATLVLSSSTLGVNAASVPLSGAGAAVTGFKVSPTQITFPIVSPGQQSSPAQLVTVTNTGNIDATSLNITASSPFAVATSASNPCGVTLAAGKSCTVGVVFSPTMDGAATGTLTVSSPVVTSTASVVLTGTGGLPGEILVQPSWLDFSTGNGETAAGQVSSPQTVTLTNPNGNPTLTGFAVAVTTGFQLASNNCPTSLAPNQSCQVGVAFAPLASSSGTQSGFLTAGSNFLAQGVSVPLTGMAFNFTAAPASTSSAGVSSGQTAKFTLAITPLNGSQGVFTLTCPAANLLPSYTSCGFNPSSTIPVSAGGIGNVEVDLVTGISTASLQGAPPHSAWLPVPLVCGLLILPLVWKRRRGLLLLVAMGTILVGGVTSCASSSIVGRGTTPVKGPGITPAGTYSIPITISADGVSQTVTLSLTVD